MEHDVDFESLSQEEIRGDLRSLFRGSIRATIEILLEEEIEALVGTQRYKRAVERKGRRNGSYLRSLLTSMGKIEVKVPRTREGGSAIDVIGRYKRRTEDVDEMLTEAYVNGVSQRKAGAITNALMGENISRSTVSRVAKRLETTVEELKKQPITMAMPYLYLDATFVDARWARKVENVAALVAYGVGEDGHRHLLAVSIGPKESEQSWGELFNQLIERGLSGVKLIISDAHSGLLKAARHLFPDVPHQRCSVHVQRNVVGKVPKRLQKRIANQVSEIFKAPSRKKSQELFKEFVAQWREQLPEAVECLEGAYHAATRFYEFPKQHWKRIRSTNGVERLNVEIKRRTKAVGAFPDRDSALRLITAVLIEATAVWGDRKYLDVTLLNTPAEKSAA